MSKHVRRREPRAHWLLLGLFMLVLFGGLCFNGYVTHVGAEGSGPTPQTDPDDTAPAAVTRGGPVLRIGAGGDLTTPAMPAQPNPLTFEHRPSPRVVPPSLDI